MFKQTLIKVSNFFYWLIIILLTVLFITLMVLNSQSITLYYNPFAFSNDQQGLTAPLFIWLILSFIVGIIIGGIIVWFQQKKYRKLAWETLLHSDNIQKLPTHTDKNNIE
ncbi:hypothetical protein [Bartonella sp. DGB1]|uniref:hypothetical protein n=1 Tax=Bartonella sp. DGB1 TaxID=3239807 RepID=UPI00352338EA